MSSATKEFKGSLGFMGTLRYTRKVNSLRKQIKSLENHQQIVKLENAISARGLIGTLGGISLYFDHVEKSGRSIAFTAALDAQIQIDGNVYATSKTSGGGSRPTLTRTLGGGLLLGPLGAVGGAMTQKHGRIDTKTTIHDDRKIIVNIRGDGGFITEALPYTIETRARTFVEEMLNISYDYQQQDTKLTPSAYMSNLSEKLARLSEKLGINRKQKELEEIQEKRLELKNKQREYKLLERVAKKEQRSLRIEEKRKNTERARKAKKEQRLQARSISMSQPLSSASSRLSVFKRWYAKQPVIITLLIAFFPVGLALMWKFADWSKKTKWIITVIIALIMLIGFVGIYNSAPTIEVTNAKNDRISTNVTKYQLTGSVSSMKKSTLSINGQSVALTKDSKFSYKASLEEGDNTFNLLAVNDHGKAKETITIHRNR